MSQQYIFQWLVSLVILMCVFCGRSSAEQFSSTRGTQESRTALTKDRLGARNENHQKESKYEKKDKRSNSKVPAGRPVMKPEFACPDRVPGPPLGDDHKSVDLKKRK